MEVRMGKKKRARKYTKEFIAEAIQLVETDTSKPIAEIAEDLGVPYQTLYQWVDHDRKRRGVVPGDTPGPVDEDKREIVRLKAELQRVKEERDFLKKAAAFFAKNER